MSTRRQFLWTMAGVSGATGLGLWGSQTTWGGGLETFQLTSRALGSDVSVIALHESRETAKRAVDAAFAELALVEELMSLYRADSQLSRLNRERVLERPHPYLVSVLQDAQRMSLESAGAFDMTVQPLWDLYAGASRQGRLPEDDEIEAARRRVDYRKVDVTSQRLLLHGEDTSITLNGIAQGFAGDRVIAALRQHGIENALVNAGELGAFGSKERGQPWTVGIQHPRRPDALLWITKLDGRCMATSGDYEMAFTPDRSCNHIFDPTTGRSPKAFASVTVLARTGVEADGLSTAAFVLGEEEGARLIEGWPGADALFVRKDESVYWTSGFPGNAMLNPPSGLETESRA